MEFPSPTKILMRTKGVRTTAGSKIFADYVPQRDAAIVTKLRQAGAVSLGKTGLHELAYGITSNNPHFGAIHNPWDLGAHSRRIEWWVGCRGRRRHRALRHRHGYRRIDPRSCFVLRRGGSEADIWECQRQWSAAARILAGSRGTADANRAGCGHRVPGDGEFDPTDYVPPPATDLAGLRIGLPQNFFMERVDPEVEASIRAAFETAAHIGGKIVDVMVPDMEALRSAAVTCLLVEAASALRPFLDRRCGLWRRCSGDARSGQRHSCNRLHRSSAYAPPHWPPVQPSCLNTWTASSLLPRR